jgi:hypothetical protein
MPAAVTAGASIWRQDASSTRRSSPLTLTCTDPAEVDWAEAHHDQHLNTHAGGRCLTRTRAVYVATCAGFVYVAFASMCFPGDHHLHEAGDPGQIAHFGLHGGQQVQHHRLHRDAAFGGGELLAQPTGVDGWPPSNAP